MKLLCSTLLCSTLLCSTTARAVDASLTLESGVALPLASPHARVFGTGGAASFTPRLSITPYLDAGPAISFLLLPSATPGAEAGIAWRLGAGARLKMLRDVGLPFGVSGWLDGNATYVQTGPLSRAGFDVGAGLAVPVGSFWLLPFVRYVHIFHASRGTGYDDHDALLLVAGVAVELGFFYAPSSAQNETD